MLEHKSYIDEVLNSVFMLIIKINSYFCYYFRKNLPKRVFKNIFL